MMANTNAAGDDMMEKKRTCTQISLVRHGQVANPDEIIYGRLPGFRLSRKGFSQAQRVARRLSGTTLSALFSSPLLRARQTAGEILRHHSHLTLQIRPAINEVLTPFEGRPAWQVKDRLEDFYSGCPPEYEQPRDIVRRVSDFIEEVHQHYRGRHVVAVTHGDVIAFTVLWAKGQSLDPAQKARLDRFGLADAYPATASITTLRIADHDAVAGLQVDYHTSV